jgi:hypothetical protein
LVFGDEEENNAVSAAKVPFGPEDQDVDLTNATFGAFSLLWGEFLFESLSERLSALRQSTDLKAAMDNSKARLHPSALEERLPQRDDIFTALHQTPESTATALTDVIVRLLRIIAQFARAPAALVWAPKATATPPAQNLFQCINTER